MPRTPEQEARDRIDAQLADCGWIVQDSRKADFSAGRGIALREVRMSTGPCDYLLLVDRTPVGVIEAKKEGTAPRSRRVFTFHRPETLADWFSHRGGLGRAHQLFGSDLPRLLDELNEELAA